jgi:hypothetical protein
VASVRAGEGPEEVIRISRERVASVEEGIRSLSMYQYFVLCRARPRSPRRFNVFRRLPAIHDI